MEDNGLFDKLIVTIRAHTSNDEEVINLLKRRYKKANPSFTSSQDFVSLVDRLQDRIVSDTKNKYIHIKDFIGELKAYGTVSKKRKIESVTTDSDTDGSDLLAAKKRQRSVSPVGEKCRRVILLNTSNCVKRNIDKIDETNKTNKANSEKRDETNNEKSDKAGKTEHNTPENNAHKTQEKTGDETLHRAAAAHNQGNHGNTCTPAMETNHNSSCKKNIVSDLNNAGEATGGGDQGKTGYSSEDGSRSGVDHSNEPAGGGRVKTGSHRQIQRLETLLGDISAEIAHLEEKEYTLEELDEENSDSILEDKLRKRFVKVWNKICEIKGRDTSTGREIERKFRFIGTRYPEVNRKIEKWVNKLKVFPDYNDIHDIVYRVNIKKHLRLGKSGVESLARDAFTAVGNQLQQRRHNDFVENFGSRLTDSYRDYNDPAHYDRELRRKLDENQTRGRERLQEVISKFAHYQDTGETFTSDEEASNDENTSQKGEDADEDEIVLSDQGEDENKGANESEAESSEPDKYHQDSCSSSDPEEVYLVDDSSDSRDDEAANQKPAATTMPRPGDDEAAGSIASHSRMAVSIASHSRAAVSIASHSRTASTEPLSGKARITNSALRMSDLSDVEVLTITSKSSSVSALTNCDTDNLSGLSRPNASSPLKTPGGEVLVEESESSAGPSITHHDSDRVIDTTLTSDRVMDTTLTLPIHQKLLSPSLDTSLLCKTKKRTKLSLQKQPLSKPYVYIDNMDSSDDDTSSPLEEEDTAEFIRIDSDEDSNDSCRTAQQKNLTSQDRRRRYKLQLSDSFRERTKRIAEKTLRQQADQLQITSTEGLSSPQKNGCYSKNQNKKSLVSKVDCRDRSSSPKSKQCHDDSADKEMNHILKLHARVFPKVDSYAQVIPKVESTLSNKNICAAKTNEKSQGQSNSPCKLKSNDRLSNVKEIPLPLNVKNEKITSDIPHPSASTDDTVNHQHTSHNSKSDHPNQDDTRDSLDNSDVIILDD